MTPVEKVEGCVARRVFLHVGTPGASTAYLRRRLWANAHSLAADGLSVPGHERRQAAAAKALVRRGDSEAEPLPKAHRAWDRLARQADAWDGDVVIHHETLAAASATQAASALDLFETARIHVIVTGQPLATGLVEAWQEQLVAGIAAPFETYCGRVRDHQRRGIGFWRVRDLTDVLNRWADELPADRVHVMPVARDWQDSDELWERYCGLLGADATAHPKAPPAVSPNLGTVESALLFEVHAHRDARFAGPDRHRWTRGILVDQVLAHRRDAAPLAEPADAQQWLREESALMRRQVSASGYDIVGDLEHLAWRRPTLDSRRIDSVTSKELVHASRWVIARLQEMWVERMPRTTPPEVGEDDGIPGILELLEHIRAYETTTAPRPAPPARTSTTDRLRRTIAARRST